MKSSIYTEERRKEILSLLQRQKRVSVNELNKLYQVSGTTIRLDLAALEKRDFLCVLTVEPYCPNLLTCL